MTGHDGEPLVSVVIPTYNRSTFLDHCLHSLGNQSLPPSSFEVIVVDDGSTDDTADVCTAFQREAKIRVVYIATDHRGPAAARNQGIATARAAVVAFIDDDCVAHRLWLEEILRPFSSEVVHGVEGRVVRHPECTPFTHFVENVNGGLFLTASMAYQREALEVIGGFDETFGHPAAEDWDLAFRILENGGRISFVSKAKVTHLPVPASGRYFIDRAKGYRSAVRLYRRFPDRWVELTGRTMRKSFLESTFAGPVVEARKWSKYFLAHPLKLPVYLFWQILASGLIFVEFIRYVLGDIGKSSRS